MTENNAWRELAFRCNGGGGCVMVERAADDILIWDSKNPQGPRLSFSRKEYADFRRRVRDDAWPRVALRLLNSMLRHSPALRGKLAHVGRDLRHEVAGGRAEHG
jgi:hypothetical protein